MENMSNHDMKHIGRTLAEVSEGLAELSRDGMTREFLKSNARKMRLGAVRLVALGNSNAGKSTLINAMLGQIAVPESGSTATPIPVWFAADDALSYNVYIRTPEGEACEQPDRETFLRKYCYSMVGSLDLQREEFIDKLWASAGVRSPFLTETGYTLIDTLGTNACKVDTAKTIATIDGGVDVVMFVTPDADLQADARDFLREHVLGLGERMVPYPVKSSQLLLVYNDRNTVGVSRAILENSAEQLLAGLPAQEIEYFKQNNIIMLNALDARRNRCGAYDYVAFAPEGTLEMEMDGLRELTEIEEATIEENSAEIAEKAKQFDALEARLSQIAGMMIRDRENGAVERRIAQLEAIVDAIRLQVNKELEALQGAQAEILEKISAVRETNRAFTESNEKADAAFDLGRVDLRNAVEKTLKASQTAKNAMLGEVSKCILPPEYINKKSMHAFRDMTRLQQEEQLYAWIRRFISESFLPKASEQFKKLLMEANVAANDPNFKKQDTVSFQVEAARRMAGNQSTRMRNFSQQLEKAGAKDIGLVIPTDEVIDGWFAAMATRMEEAILEAIARLRTAAEVELNKCMPEIMDAVRKQNIISKVLQFFGKVNPFWKALRKEAMSKAAERICDNWFSATPDSDGGNMYGGIEAAYGQVQGEIMASMNRQTMQVEKYLMELELKLKHGQEAIDAAIAAVEEINRKLDAHKDTLNALRSGLN